MIISTRSIRMAFSMLVAVTAFATFPPTIAATTITLTARQDNSLYEDDAGLLSNGAGQHLFTGRTLQVTGALRRGLVRFDLDGNIPTGSTIESVRLKMRVSMTVSLDQTQSLHRVTKAWGQGTSRAENQEGIGAFPEEDDATWIHNFYLKSQWTTPGGDFVKLISASADVEEGDISWSSDQMRADAQGWLDTPETNHGWILIGNEFTPGSAKRFDSRENPSSMRRPRLTITFDAPCAEGTVNSGAGSTTDVLRINGSAGGSARTITVDPDVGVQLSLAAAPQGPNPGRYLLWVWLGGPTTPIDLAATDELLGCTVNPTPLDSNQDPQPFLCLGGFGIPRRVCRGVPQRPTPIMAPWVLVNPGLASSLTLTLQGVLEDSGSANSLNFSVTNAVVLEVR